MKSDETKVLHPDLKSYVETLKNGLTVLRHPLIYMVPYAPVMDEMANAMYTAKKAAVKKALEKEDFSSYIFLHERPYRLDALTSIEPKISDQKELWGLIRSVWVDTEYPSYNFCHWDLLLTDVDRMELDCRHGEDLERFKNLPEEITIYRGFSGEYDAVFGHSWTLDRSKAEWFAKRFNQENKQIGTATINKDAVVMMITRRGEEEIVVDVSQLNEVSVEYI